MSQLFHNRFFENPFDIFINVEKIIKNPNQQRMATKLEKNKPIGCC